jgi:hypothetical protein
MHAEAKKHVLLGRKTLGCPAAMSRGGRNDRVGEQTWGPEHKEMAAVSKKRSVRKSFRREQCGKREQGKGDDVEEETGTCTPRNRCGDRGPGTQGRIHRDNVGKVPPAAGAGRNLQRLHERGLGRSHDRGVRLPDEGNANVRQRDSGYLVVPFSARWSDTEPTCAVSMRGN